ncbi:MAG: MauE/DoxX family redox-associated membrane protein [Ktedonobacteraceae bacterium]
MSEMELIARFIVGGTFIFAGGSKLRDIASFVRSILALELLPPLYGQVLARILPFIEILTGMMLLVGIAIPIFAGITLCMLVGFCAVLISAHYRRKSFDCGCFGANGTPTSYGRALFRNLILIILTIVSAIGTASIHHPFLWQIIMSQDVFALPLAVGAVIIFRLGTMAWEIFQKGLLL